MKRMRTTMLGAVVGYAFAAAGAGLHAQTPTGTIEGIVQDNTGALVPNAPVTIKNISTGLVVIRMTNGGGRYSAPLLLPGKYEVSVSLQGFKTSSQSNINLDVTQDRAVDLTVSPGAMNESVDVSTSSAATVHTLTSSTGAVVTQKQIDSLPLNGRNPLDMALLAPGVQGTGDTAQTTPHISGSRNANSEQQIDGVSNIVSTNNIGLGYVAYQPIVDAVQEFAVQTSVPPAEYGRTGGGIINLVTKYGTNQLHGSGFLFAHDRHSMPDRITWPRRRPRPTCIATRRAARSAARSSATAPSSSLRSSGLPTVRPLKRSTACRCRPGARATSVLLRSRSTTCSAPPPSPAA